MGTPAPSQLHKPAPPVKPQEAPGKPQEPAKSGRGRKPGAVAKERPDIPDDLLVIEEVAEEDRAKFKRRREERSEKQVKIDNTVMNVYKRWVAAGSPRQWGRCPVYDWKLPPNLVETARFWLGKAAELHGLKIFYGQKDVIENGVYHLSFTVVSRKVQKIEGQPKQD